MGSLPSRSKQIVVQPSPSTPMQSPVPIQEGQNSYVAVALCNFPSGEGTETVLRMGEWLNVLSEDGEWWKVVSLASGQECYVPSSYVAKVWHRWLYEGISREKAEELLFLPYNHSGSFLIRESQTRKGFYSLSVRRTNHSSWDSVKHYRINRLENGWLYISPCLTFPSLQDLVDYYSEIEGGLCCLLKEPCYIQGASSAPLQNLPPPVIIKKPALDWKELDSSMLLTEAPPAGEEDSPLSLGLREAISSYLFMTEELPLEHEKT
ncbi:src-like-adapter 2 [Alligator sinensis]|uniref:Src-like-adapter 2 n=1 Tax=Alligator sinensis TaxID=38654 RepID=A0A3Q0HFN2_ALLSI|nr:src-like-adapter 2 [Alligator sinensis]